MSQVLRTVPGASPSDVTPLRRTMPARPLVEPNLEGTQADVAEIISILRANVRLIVATTILAVLVAVAYIVATPKIYKATSSVVIDVRGRAAPTEPDVLPSNGGLLDVSSIETQMRLITSPPVLSRVVDSQKLADDPEFAGHKASLLQALFGGAAPPAEVDEGERRRMAIEALSKKVETRRSERTYVVEIDVSTQSPAKSKLLADAVADAYLQDLQESREKLVDRDMNFVSGRLKELRDRVEDASRKVSDFKIANGITDANGRNILEQQLSNATDELTRARDRASEAQVRFDQIQRLQRAGRSADAVGDALRSPSLERLRAQYADLVRQQANLKTTLGERHPALAEVESQLRDVRSLIANEVKRIGIGAANEYQVARDNEAAAARRVDELKSEVEKRANAMAQVRSLQQDADTTRAAYERYLRVRETNSEGPSAVVARIIARAELPLFPSAPKKTAAMAAALFGGLFTGIVIALVKDYLTPRRVEPRVPALLEEARSDPATYEQLPEPAVPTPAARPAPPERLAALVEPVAHADARTTDAPAAGRNERGRLTLVDLPLLAGHGRFRQGRNQRPQSAGDLLLARPVDEKDYEAAPIYIETVQALFARVRPRRWMPGQALKILVTSFEPETGKTLLALSLARTAAAEGASTLLVEGNANRPILAQILPRTARPGLVGLRNDPRVGFLLREANISADLCVVPILDDEEDLLEELNHRGRDAGFRDMPETASVMIFDCGTLEDQETADLAKAADLILVVAGPSDRPHLRGEDPARQLHVRREQFAGFVGSPVEAVRD